MLVGTGVVQPERRGPRRFQANWILIKEEHVSFDAARVEDAGRQPQQRVYIALLEQPPPNCLPCTALKQHVVGQDDGGTARTTQYGRDVLQEVELLVLGAD